MHTKPETGPWDNALAQLHEWDPAWADTCARMATNPWRSGVLSRKLVELIGIALNAACTNLNPEGTRRHIRGALESWRYKGGNRAGSEVRVGDVDPLVQSRSADPARRSKSCGCAAGTEASPGNSCLQQDESNRSMEHGMGSVLSARSRTGPTSSWLPVRGSTEAESCRQRRSSCSSIAFDASYTHMYAPGTRRHIRNALTAGATMEEIMEVLKLCVVQGVQACNLGVPILAEELERV